MASINNAKTSLSGQTYVDYPYDARMQSNGDMILLTDYEAVENSLRLWLYSLNGERIRMPNWGGYVTRWLFKPLNSDTADNLQFSILTGLREEFYPTLSVSEVNVTPNFEDSSWTIEIRATITRTKEEVYVIENVRRLT